MSKLFLVSVTKKLDHLKLPCGHGACAGGAAWGNGVKII